MLVVEDAQCEPRRRLADRTFGVFPGAFQGFPRYLGEMLQTHNGANDEDFRATTASNSHL